MALLGVVKRFQLKSHQIQLGKMNINPLALFLYKIDLFGRVWTVVEGKNAATPLNSLNSNKARSDL